jgi:hypothetical protein
MPQWMSFLQVSDSVRRKTGVYEWIEVLLETGFFQVRIYIRFEVFTAVTKKNAVYWDVTLCSSCNNLRFLGTYRLHHQGDKNR